MKNRETTMLGNLGDYVQQNTGSWGRVSLYRTTTMIDGLASLKVTTTCL